MNALERFWPRKSTSALRLAVSASVGSRMGG
jgi:hypothetical protein